MYSISNIRKFMSSWPLLDTDCSFINPWLAVIFIGVRPHNSPNHLRFLPGGLCSWLQEPDIFFLATDTATVVEIGRHHFFLEADVANPKWNDPTRIQVRKKVCQVSSGEWMERLGKMFFPTFLATNWVIDPRDGISIKGWLIAILFAERVLLLDAQVAVFSAQVTSWVAIAPPEAARCVMRRSSSMRTASYSSSTAWCLERAENLVWSLEVSGKDQHIGPKMNRFKT